jgi:hypothetical protein
MLFPIHTEHPELYVRATRNMTVVEEGKTYALYREGEYRTYLNSYMY